MDSPLPSWISISWEINALKLVSGVLTVPFTVGLWKNIPADADSYGPTRFGPDDDGEHGSTSSAIFRRSSGVFPCLKNASTPFGNSSSRTDSAYSANESATRSA